MRAWVLLPLMDTGAENYFGYSVIVYINWWWWSWLLLRPRITKMILWNHFDKFKKCETTKKNYVLFEYYNEEPTTAKYSELVYYVNGVEKSYIDKDGFLILIMIIYLFCFCWSNDEYVVKLSRKNKIRKRVVTLDPMKTIYYFY